MVNAWTTIVVTTLYQNTHCDLFTISLSLKSCRVLRHTTKMKKKQKRRPRSAKLPLHEQLLKPSHLCSVTRTWTTRSWPQHEPTSAFTRHTTERLWGSNDDDCTQDNFSKEGDIRPYVKAETVKKHAQTLYSTRVRSSEDGSATLQYKGLTNATAST